MDVEAILDDAGFASMTARDTPEALKMIEKNASSTVLLFTDIDMPGGPDGLALARETAERWPHISIVVASGVQRPGPKDLPEGAVFLPKPFGPNILRKHVNMVLSEKSKPSSLNAPRAE
jgi:DNA-binding NtrC family response regulator